ncbi:hypothetical protein Gotri_016064, partial [Gossypium trilobum]|nr:hypothetical protein [Gossypium trilobum]
MSIRLGFVPTVVVLSPPIAEMFLKTHEFCNQQLFNALKIESFAPSKKEVLTHFIESLKEAAVAKEVVNISKKVGDLIEKMTLKMILGLHKKYEEFNLKELIEELTNLAGAFNLADFVPFLGAFDLQ